jgi:hypothetical protein
MNSETDWTSDIENVLDNIRINSVILSNEHKNKYFHLKTILRYFRLPVIIISGINSIVSVGLQPYVDQGIISIMTCLLALVCSIIGSIELYLAIQKGMENELVVSKDYYILSVDIYKTLTLSKNHRPIPAKDYLDRKYNDYIKLFENSNLLAKELTDKLNPLPPIPPTINMIEDKIEDNIAININDNNININNIKNNKKVEYTDDDIDNFFKLEVTDSVTV